MKLSPQVTWIGLIVFLLSASVASNLFVLFVHAGSPGEVLEEDWEERAQNWDATQAQRTRNRALGWKLAESDWQVADDSSSFQLILQDRDGAQRPIDSATWVGFERPRPDQRFRGEARVEAAGTRIELPLHASAPLELSIDLTSQGERFTHTWIVYPPAQP